MRRFDRAVASLNIEMPTAERIARMGRRARAGHRHCDCKARRDKAGALTILAARRTIAIEKERMDLSREADAPTSTRFHAKVRSVKPSRRNRKASSVLLVTLSLRKI